MRIKLLITVFVSVAIMSCVSDKSKKQESRKRPLLFVYEGEKQLKNYENSYMVMGTGVYEGNKGGLINSPYMAACIANVIMIRVYGNDDIKKRYPLQVTLINDEYWQVKGGDIYTDGDKKGPPVIVLKKSDGQVVSSTSRSR